MGFQITNQTLPLKYWSTYKNDLVISPSIISSNTSSSYIFHSAHGLIPEGHEGCSSLGAL